MTPPRRLIVEADGGSRGNPGPAGYGALVRDADTGFVYFEEAAFLDTTTNNVAEYTGLIAGLRAARETNPDAELLVRMDSQLVINQMRGEWQVKNAALKPLAAQARALFDPAKTTFEWVRREQNKDADALANEAMDYGETDPLQAPIVRDHRTSQFPTSPTSAGTRPAAAAAPGSNNPPHGANSANSGGRQATSAIPPPTAFQGLDRDKALTLVLVRHGITELTLIGGLSGGGVPGPPLTAHGRTMAERAAEVVADLSLHWPDLDPPSRVLSSPMVRTQQTASAIGRRLGEPVEVDQRLREIEFGEWESMTAHEVEAQWPGEFRLWHATGTFAPPGGESYADVGERIAPVIKELQRSDAGSTVAIVGHAAMIRSIVAPVLGMPPSHWGRLRVPPCSLTIVRYWPTTAEAVTVGYPTGR